MLNLKSACHTFFGRKPVDGDTANVVSELFLNILLHAVSLQCVWTVCPKPLGPTRMQFVEARRRSESTAVSSRAAPLSWRLSGEPRSHWRGSVWRVKTDTMMTSTPYRQEINTVISFIHYKKKKHTFIAHYD